MKTKIILLLLGTTFLLTSMVYAETSGETLFDVKCASCHVKMRPSDTSTLLAPPAMGVMRHVKMTYATKEEAVKFITDYTLDPEESKAVCMQNKIKRFGLMPSQKGNVSKEELSLIAEWMYDNFGSCGEERNKCNSRNCSSTGSGQGNGQACKGK